MWDIKLKIKRQIKLKFIFHGAFHHNWGYLYAIGKCLEQTIFCNLWNGISSVVFTIYTAISYSILISKASFPCAVFQNIIMTSICVTVCNIILQHMCIFYRVSKSTILRITGSRKIFLFLAFFQLTASIIWTLNTKLISWSICITTIRTYGGCSIGCSVERNVHYHHQQTWKLLVRWKGTRNIGNQIKKIFCIFL